MRTRDDSEVVVADPHEVMAAVEAFDATAPWSEVAGDLRPVLPRRRPLPRGVGTMVTRQFPPGIRVGLGLDIGPAMLFVVAEQLRGWGVTRDQAFEQALDNVRARVAARTQFALVHEVIAGVPTVAFDSREGWASSLLLLPGELDRVLGGTNGVIVAPMRDIIIQVPLGTELAFLDWLVEEFAAVDMNALDLPPYSLIDGTLREAIEVPVPLPGEAPVH